VLELVLKFSYLVLLAIVSLSFCFFYLAYCENQHSDLCIAARFGNCCMPLTTKRVSAGLHWMPLNTLKNSVQLTVLTSFWKTLQILDQYELEPHVQLSTG